MIWRPQRGLGAHGGTPMPNSAKTATDAARSAPVQTTLDGYAHLLGVIRPGLADRFIVPPFSVLDARQGYWQERKRRWLDIGIQSELGRGDSVGDGVRTALHDSAGFADPLARAATYGTARTFNLGLGATAENGWERADNKGSGTSVFDPVLCELAYRWFTPPGGVVLDPFAGGSVRGIVAAALGREYVGIDLSERQLEANRAQALAIIPDALPHWIAGDARYVTAVDDLEYDAVFTCPPYYDLEVYSDDPRDLSAMAWVDFTEAYSAILGQSIARLAPDRFAVVVIGDVRDRHGIYRDLPGLTIRAAVAAGADLYNDAVLVTAAGSLPIRAGKQFEAARKLGTTHQRVLVFLKGDPKRAAAACGPAGIEWADSPDNEEG